MAEVTPAALAEQIGEIGKALPTFVTKDEAQVLNKSINDLTHELKEVKSQITVGNPNSTKDRNHGYKSFGDYATAVMKYGESHGTVVDERIKAVLSVSKGADEPFAVPQPPAFSPLVKAAGDGVTQGDPFALGGIFHPQFQSGLNRTADDSDDLLRYVRYIPIDAGSESITLDYVDDADRSGALVRGGMAAYWKSELGSMTETKPKMRQIKLEPNELYAFAYASDKSLRNSPIALGAFLQDGMRDAVRFAIGNAIVNGDGAAKPRGLLSSPDIISVAKSTSQLGVSFNEDNAAKMWKRMPDKWRNNAIWLMNQDCEDQLDLFTRVGVGVTALVNPSLPPVLYNPEANTLKGRPIVFCEYCATLGTTGDVFLWAPQHYLVAVKTGQGPEMSMHLKFDLAQTAFRFIFEIDGKSEYNSVLTPYKGSTTRSAIIKLDVRT